MEQLKELKIIKYDNHLNFCGAINITVNKSGIATLRLGDKFITSKHILELFEKDLLDFRKENAPQIRIN